MNTYKLDIGEVIAAKEITKSIIRFLHIDQFLGLSSILIIMLSSLFIFGK